MKTILVTLGLILLLVGDMFGQGQVTMGNNASSLIVTYYGPVAVGSTFFQLTWGNAQGANGSLTPVGPVAGVNANAAGRIANTTTPANGLTPGATLWFQILAWQSNYASYSEALGFGAAGYSTQFQATTSANSTSLPTSLAGLYAGFYVGPLEAPPIMPEPSTMALLGMGAATLLVFRRRKA